MRIPRWLLVSLLTVSVLAVLGAGAWWWVTWPERTAWAHVSLPTEAGKLMLSPALAEKLRGFEALSESDDIAPMKRGSAAGIQPERRSFGDILNGRQSFTWDSESEGQSFTEFVVVERGCVIDMGVILDKRYSALDPASY